MRDSTTHNCRSSLVFTALKPRSRPRNGAIDEAVSRDVPLRFVEVITRPVEPAPLVFVGNARMEVEYAETALRIPAAAVAADGKLVKVKTAIVRGDHATAPIAESRDAAMVRVGPMGIGRFAHALLGSTAAELTEAASCPVAIIRTQHGRPKPDIDLIVVAVNDSPGNDDVVELAIKEALLRDAPILALGGCRDDLGEMPHD